MSTALHKLPAKSDLQKGSEERELRRDRTIAIAVVLILMAALGLIIWGASVSGISPEIDTFDNWMIP